MKSTIRRLYGAALRRSRLLRKCKRIRFPISHVQCMRLSEAVTERYIQFMREVFRGNPHFRSDRVVVPGRDESSAYYVAEYRGAIIGGVQMRRINAGTATYIEIGGLTILPAFRGYGIGERLMKKVLFLSNEGDTVFLYVLRRNTSAIQLYKKLGFCVTETPEVLLPRAHLQCPPDHIVMIHEKNRKHYE